MNNITRNISALVIGIVIGGAVNMGLVNLGPTIIPLPAGADISTIDGLKESMNLFTPLNFLLPFLGHALGTLVGAWVVAKFSATHKIRNAMIVGFVFLAGGIYMVYMVGGPMWFVAVDLLLAYLPMSYLGALMGTENKRIK